MHKILILSDTHSFIDTAISNHIKDVDEVWHAGDIGDIAVLDHISSLKPIRAVFGNIDNHIVRKTIPLDLHFQCEETDVFMTHIGGYPGKYEQRVNLKIKELKPKLFICGHSHILKVIYDKKNDLLHINPGAVGKNGFHTVRTMIKLDIEKSAIKNLRIIEFPRR